MFIETTLLFKTLFILSGQIIVILATCSYFLFKAKEAYEGIKSGKIKIFSGPLKTNDGKDIKVKNDGDLWAMNYYLQGVTGKVPK